MDTTYFMKMSHAQAAMKAADEIYALRQRVHELEDICKDHGEIQKSLCDQIEKLTAERDSAYKIADHYRAERDKATQYWQIAEGRCDALMKQRDDLLVAAEAIEIDAEECLDFDECTAMLLPIDTYHKLMEAIASVKEKS